MRGNSVGTLTAFPAQYKFPSEGPNCDYISARARGNRKTVGQLQVSRPQSAPPSLLGRRWQAMRQTSLL